MKKRRKIVSWLMLSTILLANSPLVYAQEIQEIVETSQSQAYYEEAVEEARESTVGGDNPTRQPQQVPLMAEMPFSSLKSLKKGKMQKRQLCGRSMENQFSKVVKNNFTRWTRHAL
ncbi:hypothetical protein [Streptococcus suis]|uniref:hypothetical protein n=1 Tax=Streptococcus suis TaxID=1307 RepID=UPI001EDF394D|nr:hypothetical protein [Streptococcus suis]